MSDEKSWDKLYRNYIKKDYNNWDYYFKTKMRLKKRFIKEVVRYSQSGKPVIECGCGTAKTSVFLSMNGIKTYAFDLDNKMINQAKKLSKKYSSKNKTIIFKGNIKSIPYKDKFFSVAHSSGVLEHFNDKEIIRILNEQLRVADYCIFSVPTSYFEKKMLGNERFLTKEQWRKIIKKSNGEIIKETGYHYKVLSKRIIDVLKKPSRIFKPIALYTFVLKEVSAK